MSATGFCTRCHTVHDLDTECPEVQRYRKAQTVLDACARLGFKDPAEMEKAVGELVEAAEGALVILRYGNLDLTERTVVVALSTAVAHFKEARDADG